MLHQCIAPLPHEEVKVENSHFTATNRGPRSLRVRVVQGRENKIRLAVLAVRAIITLIFIIPLDGRYKSRGGLEG